MHVAVEHFDFRIGFNLTAENFARRVHFDPDGAHSLTEHLEGDLLEVDPLGFREKSWIVSHPRTFALSTTFEKPPAMEIWNPNRIADRVRLRCPYPFLRPHHTTFDEKKAEPDDFF